MPMVPFDPVRYVTMLSTCHQRNWSTCLGGMESPVPFAVPLSRYEAPVQYVTCAYCHSTRLQTDLRCTGCGATKTE